MASHEMTVVLMVDRQRERGARALKSILAQTALDRLCVLLYDFAADVLPPIAGSEHPAVTVVPLHYPSSIGSVRLDAFQRATTPIVAFLEEHTRAYPDWAAALLRRFDGGPWAGVGNEVHMLNPGGVVGDSLFVMNYMGFAAPADGGPAQLLQGNNSAYRREVVLGLGDDLRDLLEIESLLDWRLSERDYRLYVEPEARFEHANEHIVLAFWEGNYTFSRLFGALRADAQSWTLTQRWARILATPVIPFIRVARLLRYVVKHKPQHLPLILRGLPYIVSAHTASVLGQTMGLLAGEGNSRQNFLFYEMNMFRDQVI
ncbi:MAG TPA: glycosyltransferase [Candidatus Limnocylindrales bacterium]|nr:glycosyltransferase [Candidatus Limnocylindrales bacterium]